MKKVTDSNKPTADRSAHEIEITQEMIEAGLLVLTFWDRERDSGIELVRDIFWEMSSANISNASQKS